MKGLVSHLFLILISNLLLAQNIEVNGKVTDEHGKPISYVFLKDAQHNFATFSNVDGAFSIMADPSSQLIVTSQNYKASVVPINNQLVIKIILKDEQGNDHHLVSSDVFKNLETEGTDKSSRPLASFGTTQDQLHGSPYLYDEWVHGYAISDLDSIKENDSYLFNYEKITGSLLYTIDGKTMNVLERSQIKSFVFFDNNGQIIHLQNMPIIDAKHYLQILASGSKYMIYKQFNTKFLRADFQTNGITSSGNNYDSYVDESKYYIVQVNGNQIHEVALRKKSIKGAFSVDIIKLNAFISQHDSDEIDDTYLTKLGDYMNN